MVLLLWERVASRHPPRPQGWSPGQLGSYYTIDVPAIWNGTLFLYSHGTIVAPPGHVLVLDRPAVALDDGTQKWLFEMTGGLSQATSARTLTWFHSAEA